MKRNYENKNEKKPVRILEEEELSTVSGGRAWGKGTFVASTQTAQPTALDHLLPPA